jgi:hypothetical protein
MVKRPAKVGKKITKAPPQEQPRPGEVLLGLMSYTEFLAKVPLYKTARVGKVIPNTDPQAFIALRPVFINPEVEATVPKPWQPAPRAGSGG